MERRRFFKVLSAGAIGVAGLGRGRMAGKSLLGPAPENALPKRPLGRTGEKLSIIGLGGLVLADESQETADQLVREAVEHGINYFDVAPSYGNAEDRMGPALKPLKLQTDHFDLYQIHALANTEEVEQALGPDGALEAFVQAKKEGSIRFIGFSAHSAEAALLALKQFDFDTVLFPVNFVCILKGNFGPQVMAAAKEKNMGILALKALARQPWPKGVPRDEWPKCWYQPILDPEEAVLSFRFTLSQPVTAAVPPGDKRLFRKALELAGRFEPLASNDEARLRALAGNLRPLFTHPAQG
ncbi:MAG: putative oxidoreductase of the aldo/keto reductase family [Candidatus Aminicenantes bacterium]|nr:putative oxidoreductase of the aldo/keto reductase family [Candidatus Aminicenantes bacterium]